MLDKMLANVREAAPLVHCITNYVTVNDVANILLAAGGAPIMADEPDDAVDITSICGGLDINIGTLNARTIPSMFACGARARELGHPVLLDPVGAGASKLRTDTANRLVDELDLSCIRGNSSEIKAIALGSMTTKGVEADIADVVTDSNLQATIAFAEEFADRVGSVVAITGAIDVIADGSHAFAIRNGHPVMSKITGSGCMLSALVTAFLVANPDDLLMATVAAVAAEGICGEKAAVKMVETGVGNSTFRDYLIDNVYLLTPDELERDARVEEF
ncbi:MAG: hydroxyethylthiazole kinase [Coriobacteriales bacterium]